MDEILNNLPFWDNLSAEEKQFCASNAVINDYETGSYILGDCGNRRCLGMMHVISGEMRAFIISEEGREITLFRIGAGDDCVLSSSCVLSQITFDTQICVTKEAKVLIIPASAYGKLTDGNIYVRCFTYELATKRFSAVMWVMEQIIFYGFDRRLANFFLSEYEKNGKTQLNMTQEEIAVSTNSAREVVARMMKQFSTDGLIENKRGTIILKNIDGLKKII